MLKSLLGKAVGYSEKNSRSDATQATLKIGAIKTLIEFFPIGKKLRYYPEFHTDIVLDTIIVAYCVNSHFVYSLDAIEFDAEGYPKSFRLGESDTRISSDALKEFQVLVPDTSHLEMKLDYVRRAEIGRRGQFSKGNYITLVSNAGNKGVSTVDTEVAKQIVLHDGPYAQMTMILLTPEINTLSVTDQRKKPRTKVGIPATIQMLGEKLQVACTIVYISNAELRIRTGAGGAVALAVRESDGIVIDVKLADAERRFLIKGSVIRRSEETCVIRIEEQWKEGRFIELSALDLLEFKSGLINFGK